MCSLYLKLHLGTKNPFQEILINDKMFDLTIYDIIIGALQPEEAVV